MPSTPTQLLNIRVYKRSSQIFITIDSPLFVTYIICITMELRAFLLVKAIHILSTHGPGRSPDITSNPWPLTYDLCGGSRQAVVYR